jgi:tetratricopeptide (TPR) repeat protein
VDAPWGKTTAVPLKADGMSDVELGRFYLQHNDFDRAARYLAAAGKDQAPDLHNDLGVAYLEQGDPGSLEKALHEFEAALNISPRYEPALFNIVLVYERLGRFQEAQERANLYLQVDSMSGWAKEVQSKLELSR